MSLPSSSSSAYVCDTLPAPRFASARSPSPPAAAPPPDSDVVPIVDAATLRVLEHGDDAVLHTDEPDLSFAPPGRKLCVRHQRMADEGTNLKLQNVRPPSSIHPFNLGLMNYCRH
jgi:F-box/WD-40 domain protein MET30